MGCQVNLRPWQAGLTTTRAIHPPPSASSGRGRHCSPPGRGSRQAGSLRLALPEGPALERLSGGTELDALALALSKGAGGAVSIEVDRLEPEAEEPASRVSSAEVREGLLGDLLEKEPGLKAAVRDWDLDILDG